jgi:hypothetical protein
VPKKLRARRTLAHVVGEEVDSAYCRRCMKVKPVKTDFYLSTDKFLDKNGYMSICKECISEIYVSYYNSEHDLERAIYKTCKTINVIYSPSAVEATKTQLSNKERLDDDPKIFGLYKAKISGTMPGGVAHVGDVPVMDLTFQYESKTPEYTTDETDFEGAQGVIEFWGGEGQLSTEDYRFLEKEYAGWKQSYSLQTKAEELFVKQACLLTLQLEKAHKEGKNGDSILKVLQDLLKNAGLTPAQATASSAGKGTETWGIFIKNIEETTPAEYYKDKGLFKDFDNIEQYIKKYIVRPLKNFVTGSRDFNIVEDDNTEYDDVPVEVKDAEGTGQTQ